MLFQSTARLVPREGAIDRSFALFQMKKMLPEYIYDTLSLENNPLTLPEVQAVLEGQTIAYRRPGDVLKVLRLRDAWHLVLDKVSDRSFAITKELCDEVHSVVASGEAVAWGQFRTADVEGGTAPSAVQLERVFETELPVILEQANNAVEAAIRLYLWMLSNQFYGVSNQCVARLMASGLLLEAGIGAVNIRAADILAFNWKLARFLETQQGNEIMAFLGEHCVCYMQ